MVWRLEPDQRAVKALDALEPPAAKRILKFLTDRAAPLNDTRSIGSLWKDRRSDLRDYLHHRRWHSANSRNENWQSA